MTMWLTIALLGALFAGFLFMVSDWFRYLVFHPEETLVSLVLVVAGPALWVYMWKTGEWNLFGIATWLSVLVPLIPIMFGIALVPRRNQQSRMSLRGRMRGGGGWKE